jgi:DNA-binding transcriptional regulator YhcF (GntR family)
MSVRLMSMVFEADGITSTQKLVLLALADHAADDGTSIYPSVETLANKTCLSNAAVRKALKELRGPVGVIRIARRFTSRMPNKYAINVAHLAALKRVSPNSTLESGVSPDSTLGATKKHPRLSPRSTNSSLTINEPSMDTPLAASSFKTRDIQTAYESCVPYKIDWIKGDGSAAKWLAEAGYSPADIQQCYAALKAQPFWKDKPLSLTSIKKQIGEWKANVKSTEKELVFT